MNNIEQLCSYLFCCYSREKQIDHMNIDDPTIFYIYKGINALNISKSTHLIIADFGSSYNKNSIEIMKNIIEYIKKQKKYSYTPLIIHNDLPTNNWKNFFQLLINNNSYKGLINIYSFYDQCLPKNSLSIGYSSASLHYLSKKPCNILNHCYFSYANQYEYDLFSKQSKNDLNLFLKYRSEELISGGILILHIPCINNKQDRNFNYYFDLIYKTIQLIPIITKQELLDFTIPFYLRSLNECIDENLFKQYLFKLINVEFICLKSLIFNQYYNKQITFENFIKSLLILMQSGTEFALKQALEINGRSINEINYILTQFWSLFEEKLKNEIHPNDVNIYATYLILMKK